MTADTTLTIGQLTALGTAIVAGSFALNAVLFKIVFGQLAGKVDRVAGLLEAPDGVLVRTARLEERVDRIIGEQIP